MSTICYILSSAQQKALLIRAAPIELALPQPPVEVRDWLDWSRSVLPTDLRHLVRRAEPASIMVRPKPGGGRGTLTELLGDIMDETRGQFCVEINIVAVTLAPDHPRNAQLPLQWPSNVTIDGVRML